MEERLGGEVRRKEGRSRNVEGKFLLVAAGKKVRTGFSPLAKGNTRVHGNHLRRLTIPPTAVAFDGGSYRATNTVV